MRKTLAAILTLGLTGLAPAGALARPDHGGCAIEVTPGATRVAAGEAVTLNGLLTCPTAAEAAEQTVTILAHTAGTRGTSPAGAATTDPTGDFHFTSEGLAATTVFSARFARARSAHVPIRVAPAITLAGPSETRIQAVGRHARATIVFTGAVSPLEVGARVVLQRESPSAPGDWRRIGLASVAADGSYSIAHAFSRAGTVTVRTVVRRRGQLAAASEPLTYEVVRRQRPGLTIEASPDPLVYGQSVTIHGTLAGGAGASVALLARSHGAGWSTVEEVKADAGGNYEFAAQAPLANTWYAVRSGRLRSTALFEGVEPLLSVHVSQEGESATVSGTITPAQPGQVVLLERQLPSGVAWSVVGSATASEDGSFSFEQTTAGLYRIKVPRSGTMMSTASQPLALEVAPEGEEEA